MEKQQSNEARQSGFLRAALVAAGLGFGALVAAGCGQTTPPTPEQVKADAKYFELDKNQVLAANGEPVRCILYGSQSEGTNVSKSWFGFVCDFTGEGKFAVEGQQPTLTTTTLR